MNDQVDYLARYAQLRSKIQELENEAEQVKKQARTQAAHQILTIMQSSGLSLDDFQKKTRAPHDKETRAPWGSKSRGGKLVGHAGKA